jgi:hypothetical protein
VPHDGSGVRRVAVHFRSAVRGRSTDRAADDGHDVAKAMMRRAARQVFVDLFHPSKEDNIAPLATDQVDKAYVACARADNPSMKILLSAHATDLGAATRQHRRRRPGDTCLVLANGQRQPRTLSPAETQSS